MEAPEATTEKVQPSPDAPSDPKAEAIAATAEELGHAPGEETPEADPSEGTAAGEDEKPESKSEDDGAPPEVDWSDPEARATAIRVEVETATTRLNATYKGQLEESARITKDAGSLTELEELQDSDPTAFAEKLKQPDASRVWAARPSASGEAALTEFTRRMYEGTRAAMGTQVSAIAAMSDEQWAELNTELGATEGGGFAYVAKLAVEDFKSSTGFKKLITDAETRGRQDASGDLGSPPPSDDKTPPGTPEAELPSDPRQRAAAQAARQLGRTDFDASKVTPLRRTG